MTANTLALVGDIGGTNARFALTDLSSPTIELLESRALPNADFVSMQHAIEHYLFGVSAKPARAASLASIGMASCVIAARWMM